MSNAEFWNGIIRQHADAVARVSKPDTYRGWTIHYDALAIPLRDYDWQAYGPNYDAWTDDFGEWFAAKNRDDLIAAIDDWFADNGRDQNARPESLGQD